MLAFLIHSKAVVLVGVEDLLLPVIQDPRPFEVLPPLPQGHPRWSHAEERLEAPGASEPGPDVGYIQYYLIVPTTKRSLAVPKCKGD